MRPAFALVSFTHTHSAVSGRRAASAAEDSQWTMPAKDYASTRYSGLSEINAGNASRLHPVWTFSTGVLAGHEGQPSS